ncbi:MAG: FAD-binding oxidoreductase [Bacteroidetes bacterium]|nr:FAD-binding oxidoreductase [Bacteroidota bacterium]
MENTRYDYILVGQGIAGSVLALSLHKQGKRVLVIDEPGLSSCSKVAAGVWNPIVFKRLNKSWMADELLPAAHQFYTWAEGIVDGSFHHVIPMVKFFTEQQEINLWKKKLNEEEGIYLSKVFHSEFHPAFFQQTLCSSEVEKSGFLDTKLFLQKTRAFLSKNDMLLEETVDYSKLNVQADTEVSYKQIIASKIVFCEGYKALENPYFPKNAFKLTKGETCTIRVENLDVAKIVNKGVFIVPLGSNKYKVGATYNWDNIDENSTSEGLVELTNKLNKLLCVPFEILTHEAGVRPTTVDRRPLIGEHSTHKSVLFFNGFGTKAVMLVPYWAQAFAENKLEDRPFYSECDIKRFFKAGNH